MSAAFKSWLVRLTYRPTTAAIKSWLDRLTYRLTTNNAPLCALRNSLMILEVIVRHYLHDSGHAHCCQIKRIHRFELHSRDKISRWWPVFREHVRCAVGGQVVVHGASVKVVLTSNDLMANTPGPTDRVNQRTLFMTPEWQYVNLRLNQLLYVAIN